MAVDLGGRIAPERKIKETAVNDASQNLTASKGTVSTKSPVDGCIHRLRISATFWMPDMGPELILAGLARRMACKIIPRHPIWTHATENTLHYEARNLV